MRLLNPRLWFAFVLVLLGSVSLRASAPQAPATAEKWGVFEVTLHGPKDGNPFVDVRFSAVFTDGTHTHKVDGFYDGDGIYRVRFMPEATGVWHYETYSNRWELTGKTGTFTVTPPSKGNHGPVRVHDTYHFAYADGTPYNELGTTIYNWLDTPEAWQELTLKTLAASPFNKVRMLVFPQREYFRKKFPPPRWPFVGTPPHNWDFTRFNVDFFRHYEMRIRQLRDLGIQADIILFDPYDKPYGFDSMGRAADDRYLRYVVARFAAFRNVWWSMSNEFDFVRTKTMADWDHYFQLVQATDPYNHLRSIHNGSLLYDNSKPWVTHASIQNGSAVEDPGRAELYRDVWRKPVVFDEVRYEGDSRYRWGNLTAKQMVNRFWCGTVAGTYVGHGDYFYTDATDTWTSFGGTLHGKSEPRLAFLKKIVDAGPADGLDPIDKWWETNVAGQPGEYYLIYFGHDAPKTWRFDLYKNGLADGMRFKADVIDTWNMTITPVPGEFVVKRENQYRFVDASGRSIELPGRPWMAIRIQRVGDDGQVAKTQLPED
ncbi:putative endoglucanase [mine drainage metagenome]|uniref:Putative endoglucanase n=1 Tax=mine drainage metagenome TaxID=410659 RepID=A0A1J5SGG3_9ZZZZ